MVTFADLRDIDPYVFREGEFAWHTANSELGERCHETRRAMDELVNWTGPAADAAKATFTDHADRFQGSADAIFEAFKLFNEAADRIDDAKSKILDGVAEAEYWGLTIASDGTIIDDNSRNRYPTEETRIRDLIAKYEGTFKEAVAEASRADSEIAAKLRKLTAEAVGLAPPEGDATTAAAAKSIPKPGTAPADVQRWWDSLSPMEQESLLFSRAAELGMLDGIPAVARDRANRFRLVEEKAELIADKERLEAKGADLTREEREWLKQVNDKLAGIRTIEDRLHDPDKPQAFLLAIDGNANGRAIIAAGNPDTATNVATYVPGTGANVAEVGTHIDRSDRMLNAATEAGSPSTSVITWVGYDAPQDLLEAATEGYAENAKQDLDHFQEGLRATHEGAPSHNTVLGHSYGSTVIGHAASSEGLDADALVFVGSPGVGVGNVADLDFPPDQVYATVAENDMIHLSNMEDPHDIHGPDPAGDNFGAQVFASDPGTAGPLGTYSDAAHSEYWERDNKALENMGVVIAGEQPR